ncbi:MAG: class I SAM-dependent methyltransferase [Ignavibacteriaceae bacterium]
MSNTSWDKRYSEEQFAYGVKPNEFFKSEIEKLNPGRALFLGEGEGRNSVYAATLGWKVDAVDFSTSAKEKALRLAEENKVKINYTVTDLENYQFLKSKYDVVVMIFLHLPKELNIKIFSNAISALKSGGKLLIETFSKNQINNSSGGPKDPELLFSEEELLKLTYGLNKILFESKTIILDEGIYHKGKADVIRFVGEKV